jgi:hypothetical protein
MSGGRINQTSERRPSPGKVGGGVHRQRLSAAPIIPGQRDTHDTHEWTRDVLTATTPTGPARPTLTLRSATCPTCDAAVVARTGPYVIWHWAHLPGDTNCPRAGDGESQWHLRWKAAAFDAGHAIEFTDHPHRTDIFTTRGTAIEAQRSSITAHDIAARERHWQDLAWLVDGDQPWRSGHLRVVLRHAPIDDTRRAVEWNRPPALILRATAPIHIHIRQSVFIPDQVLPTFGEQWAATGHLVPIPWWLHTWAYDPHANPAGSWHQHDTGHPASPHQTWLATPEWARRAAQGAA